VPSEFLTFVPIIISLGLLVGGFIAFRQGYKQQMGVIEERVIDALKALNEAQERQIATCEKEIVRLKRVMNTIQIALKRRGLTIEINGDSITLIDNQGVSTRTMQINITDEHDVIPKDKV